MKKYFYFPIISFCLIITLIFFCGCQNKQASIQADNVNDMIALELASIEDSNNLDTETLKTLSVAIRTNITNFNESGIDENLKTKNIESSILNKMYNITNSTNGETIETDKKITISKSKPSKVWSKNISKSNILKFISKNNISISSIKNIREIKNDDGTLKSIIIGQKEIPYKTLEKEFDLNSNKITSIENQSSSITIIGEQDTSNIFAIEEINNLAKSDKNYKQILSDLAN